MGKIALATLLALLLGTGTVGAQLFSSTFCSSLFTPVSSSTSQLGQEGTYTALLTISLLVVLMVMVVLGVVYAFGYALKYESLKAFTRSEVVESLFNVILIIVISTGIAFSGGAIAFISNVGLTGIASIVHYAGQAGVSAYTCNAPVFGNGGGQAATSYCYQASGAGAPAAPTCTAPCGLDTAECILPITGAETPLGPSAGVGYGAMYSCAYPVSNPIPPVQVTDTESVYLAICKNYVTNGINTGVSNVVSTGFVAAVLSDLKSWQVELQPLGLGLSFTPFGGALTTWNLVNTQTTAFEGIAGILLGVVFLLYIIFSIFPVFLYVGILLRSFPWTRAAGGTFIAIFIAFYIIFPAIIYPFSLYLQSVYSALGVSPSTFATFSLGSFPAVILQFSGASLLNEISAFAQTIASAGLQLIGILIGFLICLSLVESIAKLLGAPSMHTRGLLGKLL
jgi:hypothetical protein